MVVEVAQRVRTELPEKLPLPLLLTVPLRLPVPVMLGLAEGEAKPEAVTVPLRVRVPLGEEVEDTLCEAWVLAVGEMEGERVPLLLPVWVGDTLGEAEKEGALLPLPLPLLHLLVEGVTEGDAEWVLSVVEEDDLEGEVEVEGEGVRVGDTLGLPEMDERALGVNVTLPERLGVGDCVEVGQREGDLEEEGVPLGVTEVVAQVEDEGERLGLGLGLVTPLPL